MNQYTIALDILLYGTIGLAVIGLLGWLIFAIDCGFSLLHKWCKQETKKREVKK